MLKIGEFSKLSRVSVRMLPRYEDEGMIWGKLAEETCRMNLVEDDPCLCAVTYLDGEYKEENVETVCCLHHQKKDFIYVSYEPKNAE